MSVKVFVTGASRGLGLALAREFCARGAHVAGTGRTPVSDIAHPPAGWDYFPADLTDAAGRLRLLEDVRDLGIPDVVVLNAGFALEDDQGGLDAAAVRHQFEGNCLAPLEVVSALLPEMLARGSGTFVAVTSLAAYRENHARRLAYSASKAALARTFENLRLAYVPKGIGFLTVYPGRMSETPQGVFGTSYAKAASRIATAALAQPAPRVLRLPPLQAALTMALKLCPESWFRTLFYR